MKSFVNHIFFLLEKKLWFKVLIALFLGSFVGYLLGPSTNLISSETSIEIGKWLGLPGKIFMRLIQMILIPLILSSIITGIAGNTNEQFKKLGLKLLLYFVFTTLVAVIIGVSVSYLFQPGTYMQGKGIFQGIQSQVQNTQTNTEIFSNIPEILVNIIPENPLQSMITGEMLSIVIFSIIIGVSILQIDKNYAQRMMKMMHVIQNICMNIVKWAMLIIPYAVFGIMAQLISSVGVDSLQGLGMYLLTVFVGLILMIFVYIILLIIANQKPSIFFRHAKDAMLLAFSTTSSAAVMPLSMKTAEDKLNVSESLSNFVIPVGTTINMDGTAIYQCISVLFITQAYGIDLGFSAVLLIMLTIIGASIGTPAVPGAGVIVLSSVLVSVGVPADGVLMIIGIERVLGMFRSTVNVTGDLTAAVFFERYFGNKGS
jgi:Na+/H+-dicarboxylate symporter